MKQIAIFASGAGSNAKKIIEYFNGSSTEEKIKNTVGRNAIVSLVLCNKPDAGVLQIAEAFGIPAIIINKEKFFRGNGYTDELKKAKIDFLVLAGFLWKIPIALIQAFPGKIINIHPALLPKYGGKGMYGRFVHEAVLANRDKESGISIHYVDEQYDHGSVIFQARCPVLPTDTPESLAERIHALEHQHFPVIIDKIISGKITH